jgi:hypothetical protein
MNYLFTSHYNESSSVRNDELIRCLRCNIQSASVGTILLFVEATKSPIGSHAKLICRPIRKRPTYSDFFSWAAQLDVKAADLVIIANSDIYFDNNLQALVEALKEDQCAALSRWDISPSGEPVLLDRSDGQDVWVFRGPLKKIRGDFPVGVPRCDNRMLYELQKAGYEVINPSFSVRAYHLHSGTRQEYSVQNLEHFIDPPYAYLWPHNLWSLPRTVLYNLRHPDARVSWRFDRRKFSGLLPVRTVTKVWRMINKQSAKGLEQKTEKQDDR